MKKLYLKSLYLLSIFIVFTCTSAPKRTYFLNVNPTIINPKAKIVADLSFSISPGEKKDFYYKFPEGDTIIFNAWVIEGNDISEISISKWPANVIFNAYAIPKIENKIIFVEKKGVYVFSFINSSLIYSKSYRFTLHRIPTKEKFLNFDISVEWDILYETTYVSTIESSFVREDTIPEEIVNTQTKISAGSTSSIQISLPKNTSYWVYWIGVGKEAVEGLQKMASYLPEAASVLGITDPVIAFALGFISQLFTLNKGYDINYCFLSQTSYFKKGDRVVTDYAKMEYPLEGTFYLILDNSYSLFTPKTVTVKVVAVKIIPKYEIRKVLKPQIKIKKIPKID